MKSVLAILGLAVAFILVSLVVSRGPRDLTDRPQDRQGQSEPEMPEQAPKKQGPFNPDKTGMITADLTIKNVGTLTAEFYPKAAPKSVEQITGLIKQGFYDGILIHRVDRPIVVQFGRPLTKTEGQSAPETDGGVPTLKFEENNLPHVPGAIGLARKPDKDSASCQLFIDLKNMPDWDGEYCVIGRVVKGMELLDKVKLWDKIESFKIRS